MAAHAGPPIGDPLLERLERLAARQGSAPARATPPPTKRTSRRHPAGARLGALLASCATTGGLAFFFGIDTSHASSSVTGLVAPIATASSSTTAAASRATTATPATTSIPATTVTPSTTVPTAAAATSAAAADTVAAFNGDAIETRYGPVQVQAQVRSGSLVAVAVVEYPNNDGKSVRINKRALPTLQSEALSAQSARVDTVSGATYTSNAYVKSLQSAIDKARAAGAMTA